MSSGNYTLGLVGLIITTVVVVLANVLVYRRTRLILSPLSLMSICFFLPLLLATLRFSTLQSKAWSDNTVVLLFVSVICWMLVPFFVQMQISGSAYRRSDMRRRIKALPNSFVHIARLLAGIFVLSFFAENYVLSGSLFPFLVGGSTLHEIHTQSLQVLGLFTKSNVSVILLLYVAAVKSESRFDRLAIPIILLMPAMRGSRIDIFIALVALTVAYATLNNIRAPKTLIFKMLIASLCISVAGGYLADYRASQGQYEISLAENVGLPLDQSRILTTGATQLFSNFVLPFENLDRLIRKNPDALFFGELTLASPILNAFFGANNYTDIMLATDVEKDHLGNPTTPTGVSTALGAFYLDFGSVAAAIPMLFYVLIWMYFYRKSTSNVWAFVLYCLYSSFFSMAAFLPIMATPNSVRVMMVVLSPFILLRLLSTSHRIRRFRSPVRMEIKINQMLQ